MLYSRFAPTGAENVMVPVGMVQEGCTVTDADGATGANGAVFTVTEVADDTQLVVKFLAVTG